MAEQCHNYPDRPVWLNRDGHWTVKPPFWRRFSTDPMHAERWYYFVPILFSVFSVAFLLFAVAYALTCG